jgi:hypothetical protein
MLAGQTDSAEILTRLGIRTSTRSCPAAKSNGVFELYVARRRELPSLLDLLA